MEGNISASSVEQWSAFFQNLSNNDTQLGSMWGVSPVSPAIMGSIGLLGNILAILVLVRSSRRHKWKTFYRLVLALALTDMFGIISTTPVVLLVYANSVQFIGGQPVCDYLAFMMVFAGVATLFLVATMSFDRFVAVWFPYSYRKTLTSKRTFVVVFFIWTFALALSSMPIFGLGHNILQYPGTWCFFNFHSRDVMDSIFSLLYCSLGLVVIAMASFMNLLVCVKIRKARQRRVSMLWLRKDSVAITSASSSSPSSKQQCRSNASQILFLLAITIVFSVCWLPLMTRVLVQQVTPQVDGHWADLLVVRMASINQILNPWIYILLRKEFYQDMCRLRKRYCSSQRKQHSCKAEVNYHRTSDDNGNDLSAPVKENST